MLAGWYEDPNDPSRLRWWDGSGWTERFAPKTHVAAPPTPVAAPATTSRIPFFGARKAAEQLQADNARLQAEIARLQGENARQQATIDTHGLKSVAELEALRAGLEQQVAAARRALGQAQALEKETAAHIVNLRGAVALQEFGLYDYENPAELSVTLASKLEKVRSAIKSAVAAGQATTASEGFTFNNSIVQGRKFVADMSKLLLRAYNAEAENCVKTVKAGNLGAAQKRLSTVVDQVERLGRMITLQITPYYHGLRLNELELASRHLQALQAEKELDRARREKLREQRKAEEELAREKARLEKERDHYRNAVAKLDERGDADGAARLREKLDDVERAITDVDYRVANVRAGYVYVISNIGSFGPEVVKIGMTRRLDPMERVHELGDASVPFRFDVHALFFTDDAVGIEAMLHQHLADRRINRVNLRREYFRATPQEVLDVLKSHSVEVLEFTVEPEAAEYRSSTNSDPLAPVGA